MIDTSPVKLQTLWCISINAGSTIFDTVKTADALNYKFIYFNKNVPDN